MEETPSAAHLGDLPPTRLTRFEVDLVAGSLCPAGIVLKLILLLGYDY